MTVSRRTMLKAGAVMAGASALPFGFSGEAFAEDDRITIRMPRDIQSLDPANRVSFIEGNVIRAVCQRLISFKPGTFEWELDAAKSITQVSPTLIEFELKPGQMFHGGYGELTAEDVKFSFERFTKPGADGELPQYSKDWEALDHVEVTGTHSGKIHLKNPAPAIWLVTMPDGSGAILSKKATEALGEKMSSQLIGSGPYLFTSWEPNQRIVLTANPDWTGPKVPFKEVVLKPVQDPKTSELAFRSGELDFTAIEPTSAEDMKKISGARVESRDSINFVWIGINVEKKPYDDIRVREAIRKAIDVDQVILAAYNGTVSRANNLVAPGLIGHWADAPVHGRDVAGAKKLLADAGLGGGFKARLTLLNKPAYQTAGIVVQAMLAEVGIDLELEVLDGGSFWSMGSGENGKNLELSLQRFGGKADPAFHTQWFVPEQTGVWNWQRWNSPEYAGLYQKAAASMDRAERDAAYVGMQKLMDESAAYIWLTHEVNVWVSKDWLKAAVLPNGDDLQYDKFSQT